MQKNFSFQITLFVWFGNILLLLCFLLGSTTFVHSEPRHGIAMHGEPALPQNYKHFAYANPDAPKGGLLVHGVVGTFDSLNPFILKSQGTTARGMWDQQFGNLVYESLMFRSRDEPFTMYGLIAEKVETPPDRNWVEFTLDPKARWSDGEPITVEDVIFTYNILEKKGRPPYSSRMDKIERIEKTGARKVRFHLNEKSDREFPLIIALSPVLPKHAIDPVIFDQSTLNPPIGSGPYVISEIDPGQRITYSKNPDYWAKDLPSKQGFDNFDTIKVEYFRNDNARFEAFKKGLFDIMPEGDPAQWARAYDFPAVSEGKVIKETFKTGKPANLLGFVFNTRKPVFKSRDTRQALAMLLDFEWINKNLYFNAYQRTASFWHGSFLSSLGVPVSDAERILLGDYTDQISEDVLDGSYLPAVSDGSGRDRKILRRAYKLFTAQGYKSENGKLIDPNGNLVTFEILTKNQGEEKLALAYQRTLTRVGIDITVRTVDDAQYQRRLQTYDFDVIVRSHFASLSPGIEQIGRWGSSTVSLEGSYNYAGVSDPAIDHTIDAMLKATGLEDFTIAVRVLDRLLISGHYVVPLFHLGHQQVARREYIGRPEKPSLYGYQFQTWWDQRAKRN